MLAKTLLLSTCAVLAFSSAAQAQSDPASQRDANSPDNTIGAADIIVTAQRRAESLLSVPLSIQAQTAETLSATGIQSITDLKFSTPGFISSSGSGYTQLYIRGIGNRIFVGANPSVSTFVDDVPRVYSALIDDLVNVERIEILKGAQGGLYGRNATGGVVNIITRQPSNDPELRGRVSYGSNNTLKAAAYANVPLTDDVAFNFSVSRNIHDGYLKNTALRNPYPANLTILGLNANSLIDPRPINRQKFWSTDAKLRLQLTDDLKVTFSGDYSNKPDSDGNGWHAKTVDKSYNFYVGLMTRFGLGGAVLPQSLFIPQGKFEGAQAINAFSKTKDYGGSAKVELALDGVDITSISAFRWSHSQFRGDVGVAVVPIAGFQTNFQRENFFQELRAVSNGSGRFQWLAGATFYKDTIDNSIRSIVLGVPFAPTLSTQKSRDWSVYAQGDYEITDNLTITASGRYVEDRKKVFFPAQAGFPDTTQIAKSSKFIPAATLSYKVSDGTVYARYAKGFKTGGVNPIVTPGLIGAGRPGSVFKPEEVDTFEVGYRANLLDRRVQFTSAVFYNKYANLQTTRSGNAQNPGVSQAIINAGKSRTYGAEASVTWQVSPPLSVSGNIGYLNAKLTKFEFPGNNVVDAFSFSGNRNAFAPEWQGGVTVNIDQPVNDNWRLVASGIASYTSSVFFTESNILEVGQKGFWLANGRIGTKSTDDRLGVFLFVQNLFDKQYATAGSDGNPGFYVTLGTPRIVGAQLEFEF